MKAQSYLQYDNELVKLMKSKGFHGKVFTHYNKGKKYPYSSDRQRRYDNKLSMSMFFNKEDLKAARQ